MPLVVRALLDEHVDLQTIADAIRMPVPALRDALRGYAQTARAAGQIDHPRYLQLQRAALGRMSGAALLAVAGGTDSATHEPGRGRDGGHGPSHRSTERVGTVLGAPAGAVAEHQRPGVNAPVDAVDPLGRVVPMMRAPLPPAITDIAATSRGLGGRSMITVAR